MKSAVKRMRYRFVGANTVSYSPRLPLEVTKEFLPRFNLSPSQETEIRKGIEFFEKKE